MSAEGFTEGLAEVFDFVHSEREDVRKMAVHGIAQQSKDNRELFAFLSSPTQGPRSIDALLQFLHAGAVQLLGDILTILINCSADGGCTEMLITRNIVRKAMRLLDSINTSDHAEPLKRGIEEMTLILLSNLTASHISAVADLLQVADADLRGFYLGRLQVYYTRFANSCSLAEEGGGISGDVQGDETPKPPERDLQKWILQILLNLTRSDEGQEILLEDEDWTKSLTECLGSPNARHRLLAAQCYRNCSFHKEQHAAMLRSRCPLLCVERLSDGSECVAEIEMLLAEIITGLMQSEEGMESLDGMNAKKHLQTAVSDEKVHSETATFLTRHVLPFLDDVVDAYVVPASDKID